MLNSINLSLNIHTYWRMSIQEWRHSLSWQEYCRKMALPISSLWGWPQLKKTTMFWLSPTYRGILILVSKGPVSPNCRQCWTSYIALHGIHRRRPGSGPSLNFPLYPLLLFPLHFHRCWPEKPSLMNILTATYHLRVCFTASPSVTRRKISICVDKSDRKRTCGTLMLWRGIYYY